MMDFPFDTFFEGVKTEIPSDAFAFGAGAFAAKTYQENTDNTHDTNITETSEYSQSRTLGIGLSLVAGIFLITWIMTF